MRCCDVWIAPLHLKAWLYDWWQSGGAVWAYECWVACGSL
jgi:hypothetical protein